MVGDVQVAEPGLLLRRAGGPAYRSRSARRCRSRARSRPAPRAVRSNRPRTAAAAAPSRAARRRRAAGSARSSAHRTATKTTVEDGDAGGDQERVGAHEAGLEAAGVAPGRPTPCTSSRTEPKTSGRSIQRLEAGRQEDRRPVEREVVRLVEVELVLEQVLRPGDPRRGLLVRAVDPPGDADPGRPERDRENRRDRLLRPARLDERLARPGRASSRAASRRSRTAASRRSRSAPPGCPTATVIESGPSPECSRCVQPGARARTPTARPRRR